MQGHGLNPFRDAQFSAAAARVVGDFFFGRADRFSRQAVPARIVAKGVLYPTVFQ